MDVLDELCGALDGLSVEWVRSENGESVEWTQANGSTAIAHKSNVANNVAVQAHLTPAQVAAFIMGNCGVADTYELEDGRIVALTMGQTRFVRENRGE